MLKDLLLTPWAVGPTINATSALALYVLINLDLLSILGLGGLRTSEAVAADMMCAVAGEPGKIAVTLAIVVAAISTLNATIFTGHYTGADCYGCSN